MSNDTKGATYYYQMESKEKPRDKMKDLLGAYDSMGLKQRLALLKK